MNATKIEWADYSWNVVTGCSPVSAGCDHCWAKRMANRQRGRNGYPADDPFRVTFHAERLQEPLRMKKPKRIAVCLMGDIFHEDVKEEWIDKVFSVMHWSKWHTFLLPTKRPERMAAYLAHVKRSRRIMQEARFLALGRGSKLLNDLAVCQWPLPNVWSGTSVENQHTADERIPWLLKCPAAVRFLSMEPLLGPVNFDAWMGDEIEEAERLECGERGCGLGMDGKSIDWIIAGGESGPGARPMHPAWVRSIRDQCQSARVPFFFKQWGDWIPDSTGCGIGQKLWDGAPKHCGMNTFGSVASDDRFDDVGFACVGKKASGRLLDGRKWYEMPQVGD